ncbi:MAG: flavin reductase family protein [Parachlamydiales bacterium]|jgi:flavin reductase (DIM6/NTAB) family NADH-FMN oxidoreductase RutF
MENENCQVVLNKCSYGLYVVTSHLDGKINGQISDALMQVTACPPKVALSINKNELTHDYILKSRVFGVSVLEKKADLSIIKNFGFQTGRKINKFEKIKYVLGKTNSPLLIESIAATFEVEVFEDVDVGTHRLFIGDVIFAKMIENTEVLTYEYYRKRLKSEIHPNSPSYLEEKK